MVVLGLSIYSNWFCSTIRSTYCLARLDTFHDLLIANDEYTADHHVTNAFRVLRRLFERSPVDDCRRVEDREVGVSSHLDAAFDAHRRNHFFQALSRKQRHLADGRHERESLLLTDVNSEHAGKGARTARMALAIFDQSIAGHYHPRIGGSETR